MKEIKLLALYDYLFFITCFLIAALCIGCGTTRPNHTKIFNDENISKVIVGMTVVEFEEIFGAPDSSFVMKFGKHTDHPWNGLVYRYYGNRDPDYLHAKRYLTNTFVFCNDFGPARLNHWKLEFRLVPLSE